jgi:hypothetical protein
MASRIKTAYETGFSLGEFAKTDEMLMRRLNENPYKTPAKRDDYEKGVSEGFNAEQCRLNRLMNEGR